MQISTIGLDIAKNVFQVHGIDAAEKVVVRRRLRRRQVLEFFKALPPCLIGMEACATAHYWARELTKVMPAKDVKAYVKRNKNDTADAEAAQDPFRGAQSKRPPSGRHRRTPYAQRFCASVGSTDNDWRSPRRGQSWPLRVMSRISIGSRRAISR